MQQYTRLKQDEIEVILSRYGIHNLVSFKMLSGGSENTNYLLDSDQGRYVLCICEQKTADQARQLTDLLKHLERNHFDTSKTIQTIDDNSITMWKGKPVILKVFIEGRIQKDIPPKILRLIGKQVAKLHQVEAPDFLPRQVNYGKEEFSKVKEYDSNSEFDLWLTGIGEYMMPFFDLNLPKSLVHSDVFWDNVIIRENEDSAVIMDFEESTYYYRVFDIGMTIIGICAEGKRVNLDKARHLLAGYRSVGELLEEELKSLRAFTIYAGACMTFWRHQNFNHLKPDPKMFQHYLGLKVLVDFMMDQDDDCFA